MALTYQELTWIKALLTSLGFLQLRPMSLFCDNQAALHIAANPVFHERTKHIEVDCHYIRDAIQEGSIVTAHVKITEQLADLLTKPITLQQLNYLLAKTFIHHLEGEYYVYSYDMI